VYRPQTSTTSQSSVTDINIGQDERVFSVVSGAALVTLALISRERRGIPAFLLGLKLLYRGITGTSLIYKALGINTAVSTNLKAVSVPHQQGIHITRAVTVDCDIEELYDFWQNPLNFPDVMKYIESVQMTAPDRARWTIKLPGGMKSEFEVEVYTAVPNELISWRSLPGSDIQHAGSVNFRQGPVGRGTEVHLTLEFVPPGGPIGQALFRLFDEAPGQYVAQFLREFKQMMETGEIATNQGQPSGRMKEASR
jgi:uncharacterized membrane protein